MHTSQTVLTLYNHHSAICGEPPEVTNEDRSRYFGYFQNEHGDQWLFVDDPLSGTATLRSGDAKWSTVHTIHGPEDLPETMTAPEHAWALACWEAAAFSRNHRKAIAATRVA